MGPEGLEPPHDSPENTAIREPGGVKSGAPGEFSAQVQAILQLPLSDADKAELLRRLLAEGPR